MAEKDDGYGFPGGAKDWDKARRLRVLKSDYRQKLAANRVAAMDLAGQLLDEALKPDNKGKRVPREAIQAMIEVFKQSEASLDKSGKRRRAQGTGLPQDNATKSVVKALEDLEDGEPDDGV